MSTLLVRSGEAVPPHPPPAWDPLLQRDGSLTARRGRTAFPSSIRTAPRTGVGPSSQSGAGKVGFWQNPPSQLAESPLLAEACTAPGKGAFTRSKTVP